MISTPLPIRRHDSVKGRVVLVTGASSGIGRAIATQLAEHGAIVIATARLRRTEQNLVARFPATVTAAACNLTSPAWPCLISDGHMVTS